MRTHDNIGILALAASFALAACTATPPTDAAPTDAAPTEPVATEVAQSGPPPGASGKIAASMVGSVSPVPAFMGAGADFKIDIQSEGEMRHRVNLLWDNGSRAGEGMLVYRGTPGPSHGAPITLEGTLDTGKGTKTIRVDIVTEACIDATGLAHPQRVVVVVQGENALRGCGELAVY